MTIYQIISLIGFPSVFSICAFMVRWVQKYRKESLERDKQIDEKLNLLMSSYQAQMRDRLFQSYKFYMKQGWVSDEDLEMWESQYQAYHSLGQNGILDKRRDQLLNLPNEEV